MKAIPTYYNDRRFRSRLEARWAAMFDLLRWPYEYEPCDYDGWIPDFVIASAAPFYVEVKPVELFPEEVAEKIDRSRCPREVLIVGTVMMRGDDSRMPSIGWLGEHNPVDPSENAPRYWQSAVVGFWDGARGRKGSTALENRNKASHIAPLGNPESVVGFCGENGGWRDRITGFYDGGCYGYGPGNPECIYRMWQEAGNMVQWMRPAA